MNVPHLAFANGDPFPALGLGTWKSEPGEVSRAIREAARLGYRHFDCSPIYGNEPEIGEAFAGILGDTGIRREELFVASKLWNNSHLKSKVRPAIETTLRDLRLDHLDLYLIHWPIAIKPDVHFPEKGGDFLSPEQAPLDETWEAMVELLEAGLCRHIGVSNFSPGRLARLCDVATHKPEVNQVECHPLLAQRELLETCREREVILTAYSPIGSPGSAGAKSDVSLLEMPELREIAATHGTTAAQVALAWALQRGTTAIPKSTNPERLEENLAAVKVKLTEDDMQRLDGLDRGHRYIDGTVWTIEGSPYTLDWLWNV